MSFSSTNLAMRALIHLIEFVLKTTRTKSINTYAGRTYENFLREYENAKFKATQKISLFFEKLDVKVASNYENALKLAVYFLKQKIENSLNSHLQMGTPLYIPKRKRGL